MSTPFRATDRDIEMMCDRELWPYYYVLPLKKMTTGNRYETGYTVYAENVRRGKFVIYLGTIGALNPDDPNVEYDGIKEVVAAGWVVD